MDKAKVRELQDRAAEAWEIASVLDVPEFKDMMRRLGDTYERLARQEQARLDAADSERQTKPRS